MKDNKHDDVNSPKDDKNHSKGGERHEDLEDQYEKIEYKQMIDAEKKPKKKSVFSKGVKFIIWTVGSLILATILIWISIILIVVSIVSNLATTEGTGYYVSGNISELAKTDITPEQLAILMEAQEKYQVPWSVLAGIAKYKTDMGRMCINYGAELAENGLVYCVRKDAEETKILAVGVYGLSPTWWGGQSAITTDPTIIKAKRGNGVNKYDLDTVSDPSDFRDSTFAVANYLKLKKFDIDPRAAVKLLLGTDAATSAVFAYVDMYAPALEDGILGNSDIAWPVPESHTLTSDYGFRTDPFTKKKRFHSGLDVARPDKSKEYAIVSMANGIVVYAGPGRRGTGFDPSYGNMVAVNHGNGVFSLYAHLKDKSISVAVGQSVPAGTHVGIMGTSGRSTGIHLHWTMWIGETTSPKNDKTTMHPLCVLKYVKGLNADYDAYQSRHSEWSSAKTTWESANPGKTYAESEPTPVSKVDWTQAVSSYGSQNLADCQR